MGLDMYLERKLKFDANGREYTKEELHENPSEEVAYWRKANQIRQWFVTNCDYDPDADCEYFRVTKEQLEQLVADCKEVLAHHNRAEEILPTSSGFFFGSTDYDEYYFDDLVATIEQVTRVIEETDWENEIIEYFEWW